MKIQITLEPENAADVAQLKEIEKLPDPWQNGGRFALQVNKFSVQGVFRSIAFDCIKGNVTFFLVDRGFTPAQFRHQSMTRVHQPIL